jgi:hypothetical protein
MTWLSTWLQHGRPHYAAHPHESAAETHARTKRAGGWQAVHFWSQASEEAS